MLLTPPGGLGFAPTALLLQSPSEASPSQPGEATRLREPITEIADRTAVLLPEGSYGVEMLIRTHAPTPQEETAAVAHVGGMIRRAVIPRGAEEERLHQFWLNTFADKDRIPRATMSAITDAELGDRHTTANLDWESEAAWHHRQRTFNRHTGEAGLLTIWSRSREGFWRLIDGELWSLETPPSPPSYQEGLSTLRELLSNVRWLCTYALRHPSAREVDGTPAAAAGQSIGFSVELRDFSSLTQNRLDEGLSTPPGWRELAGRVEVSLERSGDGERLQLWWIDLDGYPVEAWALWSQGKPQVPSLLRRQLFQLAGGRCLLEYEVRFLPLGPLERSPVDFVPPPGSRIQDLRFAAPIFHTIPPDGTLSDARAIDRQSRGLAAELVDLLQKDEANARGPVEAAGVLVDGEGAPAAADAGGEMPEEASEGRRSDRGFLRVTAALAGLAGALLIALSILRWRRHARVRGPAPGITP